MELFPDNVLEIILRTPSDVMPAVIGAAVLAFAAWSFCGREPRLTYGLVAAVAVLIIA